MENKKNKIMLTVIAIATLLVAVVGATYAYFTAGVTQTGENDTNATAAKLANLNVDVSELRKIDKGIYPGWVGYQKITITSSDGTLDGAEAKYSLIMESTNEFDESNATDNLTYTVYSCTKDKICTALEEDDIYNQGDLNVEDLLDNESNPTGAMKYYFDGAEFNIDATVTDYTKKSSATLPNTGSNSEKISEKVTFKKGNTHIYYIAYKFKNINSEQDILQGKVFTTKFKTEINDINESQQETGNTLADLVNIGDLVSYTPPAAPATGDNVPKEWTGYSRDQKIYPEYNKVWRVLKKNADGSVDIINEYTSIQKIYVAGKEGYRVLVDGLNNVANLYKDDNYVQSARHMGYNNQIGSLDEEAIALNTSGSAAAPYETTSNNDNEAEGGGDIKYQYDTGTGSLGSDEGLVYQVYKTYRGESPNPLLAYQSNYDGTASASSTSYWLASRHLGAASSMWSISGRIIDRDGKMSGQTALWSSWGSHSGGNAVRVILTLKSDISVTEDDTNKTNWIVN